MTQEQLQDILVLSEVLSFSEAADQLNLTQSALSKRVKALERELGESIFIRNTRSIELSPFGKEFLPYARQILTSYESADLFLKKYKADHTQAIALGSIRNPQCYGIDRIFYTFQKAYPEIHLNLYEETLSELARLFHTGKINLYCTCSLIPRDGDAEFIAVGRGSLCAVLPKDHPQAINFSSENLLLPATGDPFCALILEKLGAEGHNPSVVYNGGAAGCISLVRSHIGVAIMQTEIAQEYLDDSVKLIRIFPEVTYDYGLGYRKTKTLSHAERLFVRHVDENFRYE